MLIKKIQGLAQQKQAKALLKKVGAKFQKNLDFFQQHVAKFSR
jgi:hypothetical protein